LDELVAAIHAAPVQLVLAVTGGGSQAIADLLGVPGGSRTVLEAIVPYADRAVDQWLGARPEQYCSDRTARLLAMTAYLRGAQLAQPDENAPRLIGIGATASLVSSRPKRGPHRLHVAVQTEAETRSLGVQFTKGARSRREEERIAANVILNAVAAAAGVAGRIETPWLQGETLEETRVEAPIGWQDLFADRRLIVRAGGTSDPADERREGRVVMPGAFHPRHEGHRRMAEIARRTLGQPVEFELSMWNVDKPPLDFLEIDRRLRSFSADETVWLTRAPTFVEKSKLFPGATFVVGADTMLRIGQPKYYGGDERARDVAIENLANAGCRFLVFGRLVDERFETLDQLELPAALRPLCIGCDERTFRLDVSSTELRRNMADGERAD